MSVSVLRAAMGVRHSVDWDGHETDLAMRDAAFGDDRFRELVHLGGVAAKYCDFEALVVIEMDVHGRELMAMMLVMRVRELLRQVTGMMVEDVRECCDAVPGYVVNRCGLGSGRGARDRGRPPTGCRSAPFP